MRVVVVLLLLVLVSACAGPGQTAGSPETSATEVATAVPTATPLPPDARPPDLRMAPLDDVQVETTDDGRRLLRFSATIVNVGDGPMEVWAARDDDGEPMGNGVQRIYDAEGGYEDLSTDATFFWAGDGHNHWHVTDMQGYRVEALDGSDDTAVSEKHGFCLFDNDPFDEEPMRDAPDERVYTCPSDEEADRIEMGLSVGWVDIYPASLPNQFIDITELPAGEYRLWAEADPVDAERPTGWFVESDEENNVTWVDFELDLEPARVEVLEYGPGA